VRAYADSIPEYSRNRPRRFVTHCLRRLPPHVDPIRLSDIAEVDGKYIVQSHHRQYEVTVCGAVPLCQCFDWGNWFLPCKHMLAVVTHFGWECLPQQYRDLPIFVLDEDIAGNARSGVANNNLPFTGSVYSDVHCDDLPLFVLDADIAGDVRSGVENNDLPFTGSVYSDVEPDSESTVQPLEAQLGLVTDQLIEVEQPVEAADISKVQSRIRQSLAALSSHSYVISDITFLTTLHSQLQSHVSHCKEHVTTESGCKFPVRNRCRIGKTSVARSRLQHILKTVRRKRRLKKMLAKQKKTLRGNFLASFYIPSFSNCFLAIIRLLCVVLC